MSEPLAFLAALRRAQPRRIALPAAEALPPPRALGADPVNCVVHRLSPPLRDTAIAPRFGVGLKDIFHLPGRIPQGGTGLPQKDAAVGGVVRRLLAAGGVIEALLNLDELAAGGSGENIHHGRCLNPWTPAHLTGGSSGGSAAAVAAGVVPLALGSDAGGSIRVPAGWCGVTGHKPTYGRVSRAGALARGWSVDCIGPLAQSAAACAALLALIEGEDPEDPSTWAPPPTGKTMAAADLRIGLVDLPAGACDAEVATAVAAVAEGLAASGMTVAAVPAPDFDALNAPHQVLVRAEAAALHAAAAEAAPEKVAPGIAAALRAGQGIPVEAYLAAQCARTTQLERLDALFAGADLLLLPVTPTSAPHESAAADPARFHADARFTRFANFLGLPATAFPAGFGSGGLPLAAQLVGRPFEDSLCLAAAQTWQARTAFHLRMPA